MPISEIDICNLALRKVGAQSIMSLTEASENARLCNQFYPRVRDIVLRMYPWNCATRRAALSALATAPAFGWAYQYPLPTSPYCLFVQRMEHQDEPFKIEGRMLLTDASEANIIYTARIEDPTEYDNQLVQALYTFLAAEISTSLRQDSRMYQALMDELHGRILPLARCTNSQEKSINQIETTSFLTARVQTESYL